MPDDLANAASFLNDALLNVLVTLTRFKDGLDTVIAPG